MNLNCLLKTYILSSILMLTLSVSAKDEFSTAEQTQVSVETPGLFARSNAFQVDFSQLKKSGFAFPLPIGKVENITTSGFDISTKKGDAVKAMFDGTVRLSRNASQYGNVVVVRHDNGLETVYAHNGSNVAKVGQHVKAGQTIALAGSDDCQFSIMVDGRKINPETILDIEGHTLLSQTFIFKKVGGGITVTSAGGKGTNGKSKKKEQAEMSMDTNNPFGDNAVYRLDLSAIKSWHYPLDDSHVISGYGGARGHSGVDIKNAPNKEVYAVFDGLVVQSGNFSGYGKCITVRHANGLETRYSHNNKNYVNVGDKVKAGDVIGTTGRTGRATTEHLHFETRIAGRAFDPSYIFDHVNHTLQKNVLQFKKNGGVVRLK